MLSRLAQVAAADVPAKRYVVSVRLPDGTRVTCARDTGEATDGAEPPALVGDGCGASDPEPRLSVAIRSERQDHGELVAVRQQGATFADGERRLLEAYCACAAATLDAVRAHAETARAGERSRALLDFSRILAEAGPTDDVALRLADAVRFVVDCDRVNVLLWDVAARDLAQRAASGREDWHDESAGTAIKEALELDGLLEGMLAGEPTDPIFLAVDEGPEQIRRLLLHAGYAAGIVMPLMAVDGLVGVIAIGVLDRPERVSRTPDVIERVAGVAAQATIALQNGRLVDMIAQHALQDSLTGLANRLQFYEILRNTVEHADVTGESLALLYIDLDGFKLINDQHGHDVGDELLIAVGRRLCASTRGTDTVGRLGGDEFAVLIENSSGLDRVITRLGDAFKEPFVVAGRALHIGASIGSACFPQDATTVETLVHNADAAMYVHKQKRKLTPRAA